MKVGPLGLGAAGPLGAAVLAVLLLFLATPGPVHSALPAHPEPGLAVLPRSALGSASIAGGLRGSTTPNATGNLSAALGRAVLLVGLAAGAVVTLAWARVAVSWFSHDPTRKVQAKERARDALVGSLVLVAAVSGLAWGLAQWVLTGA